MPRNPSKRPPPVAAPAPVSAATPAPVPSEDQLLDARAAASLLGVKPQTLYAYTSRGLLRSVPAGAGRARRYHHSELLRLQQRAAARAGHTAVAAAALSWGEPVLDSALTRISATAGPCYRGLPAVELAGRGVRFEAVAELLWDAVQAPTGDQLAAALGSLPLAWPRVELGLPLLQLRGLLPTDVSPVQRLLCAVPLWAQRDPGRFVGSRHGEEGERARARALLRRLPLALCSGSRLAARRKRAERAESIAAATAAALGAGSNEEAAAINLALVVMADHELNASAFAARIAASVGADLYACVTAGLAVLSGPHHGGACDRVEALLSEIGSPSRAAAAIHERARRGESLPGLGHPLYPHGDPRAVPLLSLATQIGLRRPRARVLAAVVRALAESGLPPPSVDMGLVGIAEALGLPSGSASALFAVGRSAGWIGHILEQRRSGSPLRPRARYVGP
jgi:citrate synthase